MKLIKQLKLLTLVLVTFCAFSRLSWSAPTDVPQEINFDKENEKSENSPNAQNEAWQKQQSINISNPPAEKIKISAADSGDYYSPSRRGLSPNLGVAYDVKEYGESNLPIYLFGIQYQWITLDRRNFEVQVELQSNGEGVLAAYKKSYLSNGRSRSFYRYGIGCWLVGAEQMATVIKYQNYNLRGTYGYEFLVAPPLSARFDFELVVGIRTVQALILGGYSWAW